MSTGRPPIGAEIPHFVYAPQDEGRSAIDPRRAGQMMISAEAGRTAVPDSDKVSESFDKAMLDLYGEDRDFARHNDQIFSLYREYFGDDKIGRDDPTVQVRKMTVALHDPVEHLIMKPEETARKRNLEPLHAAEIKSDAIHRLRTLLGLEEKDKHEDSDAVEDYNGLMKAYHFAVDASHWETKARGWRVEATHTVDVLQTGSEFNEREAAIAKASINKMLLPEGVEDEEQQAVLKRLSTHLVDLKTHVIDESTAKHNVEGVVVKSLETFANILNPPKNNFASTFRDCIEALTVFVPALDLLDLQHLATDLRGAALEQLFDDPHGDAARQRKSSERYKARVDNIVLPRLAQRFSGVEVRVLDRIKTNGSIRKKLAEADYQDVHMVPDGIGYVFVVPDDMEGDEMRQFAAAFRDSLTDESERIILKHTHPDKAAYEEVSRKSGYKAIHMASRYYPEDDTTGEGVAVEIQFMTASQYKMKRKGDWADVLYQGGRQQFTEADRPRFERMERRAQAMREMPPGVSVESIATVLALTGEQVPFVFSNLFSTVRIGESQLMVPHELAGLAESIDSRLAKVAAGERDAIVIPPVKVTEFQFTEALSMLDGSLVDTNGQLTDQHIVNALKLVKEAEGDSKRDDEKTLVLEGHLLPVALGALMLAIQSGKIWDHPELSPKQFASNLVAITLLHDYVEKHLDEVAKINRADIPQKRRELFYEVKRMFGAEIMEAVDALTVPLEIEDKFERHEQYRINIRDNEYARIIKPVDRDQNHITDLVKLLALSRKRQWDETDQKIYQKKAREYPAKTDRHQSKDFTAPYMPRAYRQMHEAVWEFIKYFGYQPKR